MKRNEDTFNVIIVLLVIVFVLFAGILTKCNGQTDSTNVANDDIVRVAIEMQDLRFNDSMNAIIIMEQDAAILHYAIKQIQDSLIINEMQKKIDFNIYNGVKESTDKKKWYEKETTIFGFGCLTAATTMYLSAIVFKKIKE